jgi:prephenate dehydratase
MNSVLYLGPPHSFHHLAAQSYFGEEATYTAVQDPEDIGRLLEQDAYTHGVIAVENVQAGRVPRHLEIIAHNDLFISAQLIMEVNLFLCGLHGATLNDISAVYSHPMALRQSDRFLADRNWQQVEMSSTSEALLHISNSGRQAWAAIGNRTAAGLFSLDILAGPVNNAKDNHTRFFVVQKRNKVEAETTTGKEFTSILIEATALEASREVISSAGWQVFREWPLEGSDKVMLELQATDQERVPGSIEAFPLIGCYANAKYCFEN